MKCHEACTPQISLAQCSLHGTDSTSKRNDASLKTPLWHLIPKVHSDSPLPAFLTLVHGNIETDAVGPKVEVVTENFSQRFLLKEKNQDPACGHANESPLSAGQPLKWDRPVAPPREVREWPVPSAGPAGFAEQCLRRSHVGMAHDNSWPPRVSFHLGLLSISVYQFCQ